VIGSDFRTTAVNAALENAMCGHADETDDFEPVTKAHSGDAMLAFAQHLLRQLLVARCDHIGGKALRHLRTAAEAVRPAVAARTPIEPADCYSTA
jgi:hypothetical protein